MKSTNIHRGPIKKVFGMKPSTDGSFGSHTSGPVVKLPQDTKCVMRFESQGSHRQVSKSPKRPERDTMNKIDLVSNSHTREQITLNNIYLHTYLFCLIVNNIKQQLSSAIGSVLKIRSLISARVNYHFFSKGN